MDMFLRILLLLSDFLSGDIGAIIIGGILSAAIIITGWSKEHP